jgi:hypothetical protein
LRIRVLFRYDLKKPAPFKKALIDLIGYSSDNADTLIISSGYITSNIVWDFTNSTARSDIANAIRKGLPNGGNVILIAGKFEKWKNNIKERHNFNSSNSKTCTLYDNNLCSQHARNRISGSQYCYVCEYYHFLQHLNTQISNQFQQGIVRNINLYHFDSTYEKSGEPYHAKVAMRISNGRPTAMLIGSSNLTYSALLGNGSMECDVAIYRDKDMFPEYHKATGTCIPSQVRNDVAEDFIKCFVKDIINTDIFSEKNKSTFLWNNESQHSQRNIHNPFSPDYLEEVNQTERVGLEHYNESEFDSDPF